MSDAKRIVTFTQSETKFSGVTGYPVAIEDIADELSIDADSLAAELQALKAQGMIEFCAVGDSSVRLRTR